MSNKIYDENLLKDSSADSDLDWYDVTEEPFEIYGFVREEGDILSRRLPLSVANEVSAGVTGLSGYGAGGRVLFATASPEIALKVEYGNFAVPTVCNHCFSCGFDLYKTENEKEIYVATYRPVNMDSNIQEYTQKTRNGGKTECYTLNFPHYSEVKKLYIGLKKGSNLEKGKKYRNEKPVVFYGSSITHGAAAGRPGNTYENFIAQKYNLNYVNLGFAGNAKGEKAMAEYMAGLDMCVFVCDYDHNAPTPEHLQATHYPLYETIRKSHPDIPYIIVTKPDFFTDPEGNAERRSVILETYNKAKEAGDKNVYFIDGEHLFDGEYYEACTSDGCHPNDVGFLRMSRIIGSVIAGVMGIEEVK